MKIHFRLKAIEEIRSDLSRSGEMEVGWLDLSDGELRMEFAGQELYVYSEQTMAKRGDAHRHINYQLDPFATGLFEVLVGAGRSVSGAIYGHFTDAQRIADVWNMLEAYEDLHPEMWEEEDSLHYADHDALGSMLRKRLLIAYPHSGIPMVYFFRHGERVRLIWEADATDSDGTRLWDARSGAYEMDYLGFADEVKSFYSRYMQEMRAQLARAIETDWGQLRLSPRLGELYARYDTYEAEYHEEIARRLDGEDESCAGVEAAFQRIMREVGHLSS